MAATRRDLVRNVWPDKLLYACIMLLVTGLVGALYAAVVLAFGIKMSPNVPSLLRAYPPAATLALSLVSVACAWLAMRTIRTWLAFAGAIAGVLSLGLLGVGSGFAVLALLFVVASALEHEESRVRASKIGPESWPDKSLAASLLVLVGGLLTIAWGVGVLVDRITFMGGFGRTWALIQLALGAVAVAASVLLYQQRGYVLGIVGACSAIVGLGGYVLAPLLGIAALVAIRLAEGEGEFDPPAPTAAAGA